MNQITEKMGPFKVDYYIVFAPRDDASYSVDFLKEKPTLPPFCASIMKLSAGQTATLVTSQYKVEGKWAGICEFEVHCEDAAAEKPKAGAAMVDPGTPPPSYCIGVPGSGCGMVSPCPLGTYLENVDGTCKCVSSD